MIAQALALALGTLLVEPPQIAREVWTLGARQEISDTEGGFTGVLANQDQLGSAVAALGDLDGDGVGDVAVGAWQNGPADRGAVWILFLNADGTVKAHRKIAQGTGGFGTLDAGDRFGASLAALGDLDGDGVCDLAVGALLDDDGGTDRGAVWVLFLNADGTVRGQQKISDTAGGFTGALDDQDQFAGALAGPGDLDGDGVLDLLVGAPLDDDGGTDRGAVWALYLNADGTVKAHLKLSDTQGGFPGVLDDDDRFGASVAAAGDLDGNGVLDLVVGAPGDDDGALHSYSEPGAVWLLFLQPGGAVGAVEKIGNVFYPDEHRYFGSAVSSLGDLDGDGLAELAVGAPGDDGGAVILFLEPDYTVGGTIELSYNCGFQGEIGFDVLFGRSLAAGDVEGDGVPELFVGMPGGDDGGIERGSLWVVHLDRELVHSRVRHWQISATEGGFTGALADGDSFGWAVTALGDLDGDGVGDLAVGAPYDGDGGPGRGAVWILFMNADRTVRAQQKISVTEGGFTGVLSDGDYFGWAVSSPGDVDGDGVPDVVVGAPGDDETDDMSGGYHLGAVWVLFLNPDGTVRAHQKISDTQGNFTGALSDGAEFGCALSCLGDVDLDGVPDLAVGAFGAGGITGGSCIGDPPYRGAVWILLLHADGTVKDRRQIGSASNGFTGHLEDGDWFGWAVTSLGDLDGDGVVDLAIGAPLGDCQVPYGTGSVWIVHLNPDGTVKDNRRISTGLEGFTNGPGPYTLLGCALAPLGDRDGDGTPELAVGAGWDGDGGCSEVGAIWLLSLNPDGTVAAYEKISATQGGFTGEIGDHDAFGWSLANLGDVDGDGKDDLAAGSLGVRYEGVDRGTVWQLSIDPPVLGPRTRTAAGHVPVPGGTIEGPVLVRTGTRFRLRLVAPPGTEHKGELPVVLIESPGSGPLAARSALERLFLGRPWSGGPGPPSVELRIPDDPRLVGHVFRARGFLVTTGPPGPRVTPAGVYELEVR